ncbi:serine/threonine-protein kinase Nek4 [Pelodytes ibericus]
MEEPELRGALKSRLEDYCFIKSVGKGSYGEVSLAQHRGESRQYVIKKLNLQNAPRRERRAAEQEAQLLSRLKHPNIVAYKESWEGDNGLLYIVMGYCEGGDLYRKLKDRKGKLLAENQVVDWFVQIAMALQYLHDEHIMHRDLKTQNIFLTRSNIIKVGDLGIARVLETQYDMASTLIGTPYYMSPELFSNKPYNYKSDVWALGCCVYEMTTLKHAFNAKDMNSLVYRIIEGKLPPMPKEYSSELGELIGTMLSRQPDKRPTVRQILRKPFIKRHITLFLQATKLKHKKKVLESCSKKRDGSLEIQPNAASDREKRPQKNKEKSPVKSKPVNPAAVPENPMSDTIVSISTLSKVDIDILSTEKKDSKAEHPIQTGEPGNPVSCNVTQNRASEAQESQAQEIPALLSKGEKKRLKPSPASSMDNGDDTMKLLQPGLKDEVIFNPEDLEVTEKLLEPFVAVTEPDGLSRGPEAEVGVYPALQPHSSVSEPSVSKQRRHKTKEQRQASSDQFDVVYPRPLPSPPAVIHRAVKKSNSSESASSVHLSKSIENLISQDNRPLSARERRRLKQSQEEIFSSEPAARRYSEGMEIERSNQSSSANPLSPDIALARKEDASEDELSSSNSSTEKSEGDCKDRKCDSNEMQDLVQLMTQTLHMEKDQKPLILYSEFKLHRKYRDTLILHGKSAGEVADICPQDIPPDHMTAPEKFRRMIEALRTDVVQALGVKLLEEVYDIMEEEDDIRREVHLKKHLGDKYTTYSQKVHQLKFFEENSKF